MAKLVRHPLVDEILDARRDHAHGRHAAFEGYRNHAHRIQNFVGAISSLSPQEEEKVAIAAAFHDLYAFDGLDYLEKSIEAAAGYLRETCREAWDRDRARDRLAPPGARISREPAKLVDVSPRGGAALRRTGRS